MLLEWKLSEMVELNIQKDHVHLIVSVSLEILISQLIGILKGKTAIKIFKSYPQLRTKPYWGNHFWAKGYCVDTIDLNEDKIKKIKNVSRSNSGSSLSTLFGGGFFNLSISKQFFLLIFPVALIQFFALHLPILFHCKCRLIVSVSIRELTYSKLFFYSSLDSFENLFQ